MKYIRTENYDTPRLSRAEGVHEPNAAGFAEFISGLLGKLAVKSWVTHVHLEPSDPMGRGVGRVVFSGEVDE